jgi:hypothetical protein
MERIIPYPKARLLDQVREVNGRIHFRSWMSSGHSGTEMGLLAGWPPPP